MEASRAEQMSVYDDQERLFSEWNGVTEPEIRSRKNSCDFCGGLIEKHEDEAGNALWRCSACGWIFGSCIPVLKVDWIPKGEDNDRRG